MSLPDLFCNNEKRKPTWKPEILPQIITNRETDNQIVIHDSGEILFSNSEQGKIGRFNQLGRSQDYCAECMKPDKDFILRDSNSKTCKHISCYTN